MSSDDMCVLCDGKITYTVEMCPKHDYLYCARCVNTDMLLMSTRPTDVRVCIHPFCNRVKTMTIDVQVS
jgi:hypothetical protein